jgi:hypothetical protein
MHKILTDIALKELKIPTLEPRGRDHLDFHEVGVMSLSEALTAAYKAGQNSQYGIPVDCIISALASILKDISTFGEEANDAIQKGEQNQAIGALLYLEEMLPAAQALYKAALTLHRLPRKGGAQ